MKEFFKYALFYHRLTNGKIYLYVVISLFAVVFEGMSLLSLVPIMELGVEKPGRLSMLVYQMLNGVGITTQEQQLLTLLIFVAVCFSIASIGLMGTKVFTARMQGTLLHKVEMSINEKLFNSDYQYFISHNMGFINNAIMRQVSATAFAFKHFATIITGILFAVVYSLIPLMQKPLHGLSFIILISPAIILLKFFNHKNRYYSIKNAENFAGFNGFLMQMLSHFKYFKATGNVGVTLNKLEDEIKDLVVSLRKLAIWGGTSIDLLRPYAIVIIAGMVYYAFAYNNTSIVDAGALFMFFYLAYQKAIIVPSAYQKFLSAVGSIKVYEQLYDGTAQNPDEYMQHCGNKDPDFSKVLSLKSLSFQYNTGEEKVLKNINLEILPRQSVALVGESGSGKSTLVNILTGLFKPKEGSISLGEVDYAELNIQSFRSKIGYITQEPVIFNDTVANNISLWEDSREKVISSAKKAHADIFIQEMQGSYDTLLGDSGVNISGGQRQRITIARELYRDTPILIFDEATSALDSTTEEKIQREIDELKGERTIIMIAHRLATIKNCDFIYVMDKGEIVEQGTYKELYDKGGKFRTMVDKQSL